MSLAGVTATIDKTVFKGYNRTPLYVHETEEDVPSNLTLTSSVVFKENHVNGNHGVLDVRRAWSDRSSTSTVTSYATMIDNSSAESGGAVGVGTNGKFVMKGGKIEGNSAQENGGGVLLRYGGNFILEEGSIKIIQASSAPVHM